MKSTNVLLAAGAGLALLLVAPAAGAQTAARGDAQPPRAVAPAEEDDDWAGWMATLEESRQTVHSLRKTVHDLETEWTRAQIRRRPRGEERARLFEALERARDDLAEAEAEHPRLLEAARRAGVPQGMLSDYEDLPASGS